MTSRIIVTFFLLNLFLAFTGQAQVTRDFEDRVSYNVNGNITMTGNTLMSCALSWNDWNCNNVRNGSSSGSNHRAMFYVNSDSAAGYNNSSSASLTLPNGATVLHAELYWSGREAATANNRDKIRIKAPGSNSYTQVTAHTIDTYSSEGESGSRPYQASADVTQIVVSAGAGDYTVADLTAKEGSDGLGFYGGWAIAVVYQDNTEPFRRLMLFDGAAKITGTNTVSITTDNLVTPFSGNFNTYIGALVWEGDESLDGDAFVFEGTTLTDSLNPNNNYWNSSITSFNSRITSKNPDYVNQLGMDLVMTDVSGLLSNGKTQANIDFVTDGDSYFPHVLAFVTDLYLPDFNSSMDKTAIDLNGGQVEPGDVIEYRVSFENTGQDVAINTVVTDALPTGISYLPNSLEIVSSSAGPAGAMSDTIGDDAAEYDADNNSISFWVGNNAVAGQGGDFLPGESAVVKFLATVDPQNSGTVSNTATINFNAQTTPDDSLIAEDNADINVVATASINVIKTAQLTVDNGNPGTADADDEITFSISVENTGNMDMSNISLTDIMAPLGVTCPSNSLTAFSSMNCDGYSYIVTQSDMNAGGSINNTVELTAQDAANNHHQDSASTQTLITLLAPTISSPSDGDLLNDNTPTVSGTGLPGTQIDVLTDQDGSCQATVDASGQWSCDISPVLMDGSVVISAFASDGGSNQSATNSVTVDLDATAPISPGVDSPTNGEPITGTGEPGATVTVVTESGGGCTAVVQGDGTWSCTITGPAANGDDITVTQEDDAGNESTPTVIPNGLDTEAPTVTITAPVDGDLTNDNTPTVSGTSEAGAEISVTIGDVEVCSVVADNNGDWSCDVNPAVADGSVQIDVTATDAANNTSNPESVNITVDATPPGAPGMDSPSNGQPITGTGEPGATVTVVTESGGGCTAVVQGDGTWSCTITGPAANGDDITVTQEDDAGNESTPTVIPNGLDTEAPTVTITAPVDGDLTNDNTPTVSGTSEAGAEISVIINGIEVCSAVADGSGNWSCNVSPAVADGSVQIDVTATDAANNTSNPESVTINVDTTTPDAPVINAPTNGQPVSGTGEPGATINVSTPGGASCTATVQANGTWSCTLTGNLVNGDNITATQTDPADNTSSPTTVTGGLDTEAPTVTITAPVDGELSNDNTPTVSGTSEAGTEISVTIGGVEVCSVVADNNGDWFCDVSPSVADGSIQIDVTASDAAGNTSNPESVTIDVDTTAPIAPLINTPTNGQPVTGTDGEPGATIHVTTPGGASCQATVQGDGSWSCTLTGNLVNGDDITATQTDEAGNESDPTTLTSGLDTEAPTVSITTPVNGDLTNNNTPTVSGTSEAGSEISVIINGIEVCSAVADGSGNWSCDVSPAVADGTVQIDVTASDAAGNTSNPESVSIDVDTTVPNAPVINAPTNGQPVSGTGEPGATVNVSTPGGASCTATVQANGTWSCTLTGNLVNGDDITATQTDEAGNESDPTTETGGLDTEAPGIPTITTPQNGTTINNASPVISGTAEANSTVTVSNQSGAVCVAQTNTDGQWSCSPDSSLADGVQQLEAVAEDAAGNESQPGTSSFTVNSGASHTIIIDGATDLTTTEAGGTDGFTIVLPLTPTADVTVNLSSSDTTEGTVSPASVTFTTTNWNQPVTVTVTGVDDQVYDQDQPYTIDFSLLSSADNNYNGVQVNSVDVINEDDDAQPDLSVFITNCIDGSLPQQPISYYLTVTNEGNTDIQGARLTTVLPGNITNPQWDCVDQNGLACNRATGQGDLDEIIDLNSQESMLFTFVTNVDGNLHDFLDVFSQIDMPLGETDVNLLNNQAEDHDLLYQFIHKHGFECAAPGTVEVTNQQLEQLFNLR